MIRQSLAMFAVFALLAREAVAQTAPGSRLIDDFESVSDWSTHPSDNVEVKISTAAGRTGHAMRIDYDFHGGGGYAIVRKVVNVPLPANYEFAIWIRGNGPRNDLEFKLIDSTGESVWWKNRRKFSLPERWTRLVTRARQFEFAWGPAGGGTLGRVAAIEFAITAGEGGRGTVWLDDFTFAPRQPPPAVPPRPVATATSALGNFPASAAVDDDSISAWRSSPGRQSLTLDLGYLREFGAVVLSWEVERNASAYTLLASEDAERWDTLRAVTGSNGGRDFVFTPESEARYLRLAMDSGSSSGYGLRDIDIESPTWAPTVTELFERMAAQAPVGSYPKYLLRRQSYWTIVGVSGGEHEGLLNEEGMLEPDQGSFSIEPFLLSDGRLITWADVHPVQSLENGELPIPTVRWPDAPVELAVTAYATGEPGSETLWARYRITNTSAQRRDIALVLAIRPLQVNPSWQFLSTIGGSAPITSVTMSDSSILVNDSVRVESSIPFTAAGAARFAQGDVSEYLREGRMPPLDSTRGDMGHASAAVRYDVSLAPGSSRDVYIRIPWSSGATRLAGSQALDSARAFWQRTTGSIRIDLPPAAQDVARTIRSTLAYVLINREGPAIQPGSRSYDRSWIRDGALTSEALLRLGYDSIVRSFIEWFAPYQFPSGKVPCCVDASGAGPVPENDSHGEFIWLLAEYLRFTSDTSFLRQIWPHAVRAVSYMDSLRHERLSPEYDTVDSLKPYRGLMTESISHEGYSAHPVHSYWDDFFAMRGFRDAAWLASVLGDRRAAHYAALRDSFQNSLASSVRLAMKKHDIDYVPGSVELGDFDATSTTVALEPEQALSYLPRAALKRTFDRYWSEFEQRRKGEKDWDAYTPYELRTVGAMLRLGHRDRALSALEWFLHDRRPAAWNEWAEVVWRDRDTPKFIGDMPHTWVGSDFIRSALDLFAYERALDSTIVIAAGIPAEWLSETPVRIEKVHTTYGTLDLSVTMKGDAARVEVSGALRIPPGGLLVSSPFDDTRRALVDHVPAVLSDGKVRVRSLPAVVEFMK